jgi:hypothetical protein
VLGGLVGLYARQAQSTGVLGLVGFAAAFSGSALSVGIAWLPFPTPFLALAASGIGAWVGLVLAFLGWALFGVATMRADVFPRTAAIVLLIGAVLSFTVFVGLPGILVLDVAIAWMGLALLSGRAAPAGRRARAR